MFRLEFVIDREETIKAKIGKGAVSLFFDTTKLASWFAVSGGYGNGEMDLGEYVISSIRELPDTPENKSYKKDGFPWICLLDPQFKTTRTQICAHSDGGVYGSLGCMVIQKLDIAFFFFIKSILMVQKNIRLVVKK